MARATGKTKRPAKKRAAQQKKQPSFVRYFQQLASRIPEDVLRRLPTDLAEQHDHYIYGTPKK